MTDAPTERSELRTATFWLTLVGVLIFAGLPFVVPILTALDRMPK